MKADKIKAIYEFVNQINQHFPLLNLKIINGMANEKFGNTEFEYLQSNSESVCCGTQDYTRYRQAELIAEEIIHKELDGAVAELGVYQGDFAQLLNKLFFQKKLYLFDTFEGFYDAQIKNELENNLVKDSFVNRIEMYLDTSLELVMSKMKYPTNCKIYKGNFPDTTTNLSEKFCFVSIDVDFYQITLEGLKYFYPRMVDGGYIMIHDYNDDELFGVKKAIYEYIKIEPSLKYLPITDSFGSVIIIK